MSSKFFHGSPMLMGDNTIPGVKMPEELEALLPKIFQSVKDFGCDYYPTRVEMLTYDEISEVAAYGGFPVRYPHWQWGMEYEELQRGFEHGMHRIYEMVVNSSPCYIYCLDSNTLVDNVTVVAHALGHNDFFKNNVFFAPTSQNMMNQLASNGTRIRRYMSRWGKDRVTKFIDHVLRLETLIDPVKAWDRKIVKDAVAIDKRIYKQPKRLPVQEDHEYMEDFINPPDWKAQQREKVDREEAAKEIDLFKEPTKDILGYLRDHAPLKPWQQDIVAMLYEESMYFSPQRFTKTLNEGWACTKKGTLIFTSSGILPVEDLVDQKMSVRVYDGEHQQRVHNWFVHLNRRVITIKTRRGYTIGGADNHRIVGADGQWVQLGDIKCGDSVKLTMGADLWSKEKQKLPLVKLGNPMRKIWQDYPVSSYAVIKYANVGKHSRGSTDLQKQIIEQQVGEWKTNRSNGVFSSLLRNSVTIPESCDVDFAYFLGLLIGDGHISDIKRVMGLTSGDKELVDWFARYVKCTLGIRCRVKKDNGRYRALLSSKTLRDLLVLLGLTTGFSARHKKIPGIILRSPKEVVSAFLRGLFDTDGYAGESGVILSTSSCRMVEQIQVVLSNFGILSNVEEQNHKIFNVSIRGSAAKLYAKEIGFSLGRKTIKLKEYLDEHQWFRVTPTEDEVVSISESLGTVYDFSVKSTYRYAAQGFMNHNSFIDFNIMSRQGLCQLGQDGGEGAGIVEYATHKVGVLGGKYSMNPYKLGYCLFMDIEERWDKGQFGSEWDDCKNIVEREKWDKKLGLGHEKVFEVRRDYNDITALLEFFTEEFAKKYEFFEWKHFPNGEYRIISHEFKKIKQKLISSHLNGGLPDIRLDDPNFRGEGTMMLQHYWDGRVLHEPYVAAVLQSLYSLWGRDIYLASRDSDGNEVVWCAEGEDDGDVELVTRKDFESEL